ncbi:DEAD box RNA helicase, putative [Babesia bigemina]|uniref:RNA helicase n=1 Tax=Babesia bigemina TaxID=5866 RepID=A0A061D3M1_BABBI|nr:DEAD box RNA helicase, putative [Babesia bigemina]CDR95183.1 DEAD box RNA helicase, putative [Babesia bigemina]|eukprot:XP_012767369.1 DEAD box RNA helicase, putative [Babesia bigemina]
MITFGGSGAKRGLAAGASTGSVAKRPMGGLLAGREGLKAVSARPGGDSAAASQPPKVVYIPKAQREKRLEEEAKKAEDEMRQREEAIKKVRMEYIKQAESNRESERRDRHKRREIERIREGENKPKHEAGEGAQSQTNAHNLANSDLAGLNLLSLPEAEVRPRLIEKELEQIRQHYLGIRQEKKKVKKPSEKFKTVFNFEWDNSEDTSVNDNNPIYQNRPEPQLLFGRGCRAGIDVVEQRKGSNFYDELSRRRGASGTGSDSGRSVSLSVHSADRTVRSRVSKGGLDDADTRDQEAIDSHWSSKTREQMTDRDWRIVREDFDISVKGSRVPPPIRTWSESDLPWEILQAIKKAGFSSPTPIQMQAIPVGLQMRDLIGIAETGSGKTLAFVLPMITYVKSLPLLNEETARDGPYSLTMAPTRELAQQIHQETVKFSALCKTRAVLVVGGHSIEQQGFELRNGAEIIIGTPGRIKDCLDRSYTVLSQCNYVILDEADRMIDMGFEDIVNEILDCIPTSNLKDYDEDVALQEELKTKAGYRRYRITQMFSATMPPAVEKLTKKYLRSPVFVAIGDIGSGKKSITQRLEFVTEARKKQKLEDILEGLEGPIIVFVNMKKVADVVARHIVNMGYRAIALHGGKNQDIREGAIESFKSGEYDILVATDVIGRGLDVKGVTAVINFDMPKDIQTYTHRIGRTGRAGAKGLAISLVTDDDSAIFYDLKQQLITTENNVPPELEQHPATNTKPATANQPPTD